MAEIDIGQFLKERGVSDDEIVAAREAGTLPLLVADQLLLPGQPRYSRDDLARITGADPELMQRLWRAMGFPDLARDEVAFYDADLEALEQILQEPIGPGTRDDEVHQARVISSALSRIAEVGTDGLAASVWALREAGAKEDEIAELVFDTFNIDEAEKLLDYVFRRQLRAAVWRRLGLATARQDQSELGVGFVDLVRFTAITEDVPEDELDRLVSRFEEVSHEVVTVSGGRVVKMIGDAVMYVADDPANAVDVAVQLVDAYSQDDLLPPARAGLAYGPVLFRDGDYFGPVVNLASRIVDVARPRTVVASEELHQALADEERYTWRRLPPKRLKGIGYPPLWSLRRAG
jgi:adenylate cyclase